MHTGIALAAEHQGGRAVVLDGRLHAATVSLASAGRMTCRKGIARSVASCSTGWWVGPSSPTPTESWVNTKTTLAWLMRRQAHRRAHVVEEDEERAAGGEHAAVHGHADHRRAHRVLAHAEVDLAAAGVLERLRLLARRAWCRCCR